MSMSPEDQKYYETYFDLFATDGWEQFKKDIEQLKKLKEESVFNIDKSDDYFIAKGEYKILVWLYNLEEVVRNNHTALEAQEEETDIADL